MIELTFNTALMLYLSLTLFAVLGVWGYSHYHFQRKKIISAEKTLFICEYCHCAYLAESLRNVNRCPQCNSFNKDNNYTKIK